VRKLALETPLVAMDVVEVAPAYDWADTTINNAHRAVLEVLAGLAVRRGGPSSVITPSR
jgi:agmatinase